ncbi:MAG: LD-carboxypeptidase [Pseudanabaenaceae cyanobacterium]
MQPVFTLPQPLQKGDRVAVIAPSGCVYDDRWREGLAIWQERYELVVPTPVAENWGYLAGTDEFRCSQFIQAWNDPSIKGIVCVRGGYGCTRLLEKLDWQKLQPAPKWLIGFSDVTALLWAVAEHFQTITLHAPVLSTIADEPEWSVAHLFNLLEQPDYQWALAGQGWGGIAQGKLWAGNLTVATSLIGTPFLPDMGGSILAFEDIYETPYRLDRLLTQWRLSGILAQVAGIALGRFSETTTALPTLTVEAMLEDRLGDLGIPIVSGLNFGHQGANPALPLGQIVTLDGDRGYLYSSSSSKLEELGLGSLTLGVVPLG